MSGRSGSTGWSWVRSTCRSCRSTTSTRSCTPGPGAGLVAAIGASLAAWSVFEAFIGERLTARLDRAAEVVRDEYGNLVDDARIIVGLYADRALLRQQIVQRDETAIAEALQTATNLRAI